MKAKNASANTRAKKDNATELQVITTTTTEPQTELQTEQAKATEKPKKAAGEKKAEYPKLDFSPARKYTDRVREGAGEVQSLNSCFRELKRAYNFLQGMQFADFAEYINKRYKNAHKAGKSWSAWYAAQFAEKYIKEASADKDSTDHAAAVKYLCAAKLERDADGIRKL